MLDMVDLPSAQCCSMLLLVKQRMESDRNQEQKGVEEREEREESLLYFASDLLSHLGRSCCHGTPIAIVTVLFLLVAVVVVDCLRAKSTPDLILASSEVANAPDVENPLSQVSFRVNDWGLMKVARLLSESLSPLRWRVFREDRNIVKGISVTFIRQRPALGMKGQPSG